MAIYHLEAKVISRGIGRSAVAASAYMSCSKILNDYDGVLHDYTRKQGLVYEQVFLPPTAPPEWKDRRVLWNAVEETEKTKDSRLAREFVVALPAELDREQNISLLKEFVQENFVNDGMCADVCIHDTDGHNPHAHIMLTVRPLDEKGKWQAKTQKEYICKRGEEERGFTADEFKTAQADGWEKQYQYFVGKKKIYLPPSIAELQGYERASKYPKSTKYGRQNPVSARWNSEEQLLIWREKWADISNKYLEMAQSDSRIDHRSNAARGIDEQPTIHEGVSARIMEKRGFTSERCELNRQIKADNKLLRELKQRVKKLVSTVKNTLPAIADTLETMRKNIMIFTYRFHHTGYRKSAASDKIQTIHADVKRYMATAEKLKSKTEERKTVLEKKQALPVFRVIQHREISRVIAELTEEIEELRTEKNMLLKKLNCEKDGDIPKVRKSISEMETALQELEQQEEKYHGELHTALKEFSDIKEHAKDFDELELIDERLSIRPQKQQEFNEYVKTCGVAVNPKALENTLYDIDNVLLQENLEIERRSIFRALERYKAQQHREERKQTRRIKHDEWDMEL